MVFVKGPGLYTDIGKKARGKWCFLFTDFVFVCAQLISAFLLIFLSLSLLSQNDFYFYVLDLLYKDYQGDQKFTLTTYTANGVVSVSTSFPCIESLMHFYVLCCVQENQLLRLGCLSFCVQFGRNENLICPVSAI